MSKESELQKPKRMGAPLANTNAVTHGLYRTKKDHAQSRSIGRRANHRLRSFSGDLRPVVRPAMKTLLELEGRIDQMRANIEAQGLTNEDGQLRGMVPELRQTEKLLLAYYEAMGMTPASYYATRKDSIHGDILALQRWVQGDTP